MINTERNRYCIPFLLLLAGCTSDSVGVKSDPGETLLMLLGLAFVGSFIYVIYLLVKRGNRYITNNTIRNRQVHTQHNLNDAEYFERKYPQHHSNISPLKYKGVYLYKSEVYNPLEDDIHRSMIGIFFTEDDAFIFKYLKGFLSIEDIRDKMPTLFTNNSFAQLEAVAEYKMEGNKIAMKFEFPNSKVEEFEGIINKDDLVINSKGLVYMQGSLKPQYTNILFEKLFKFYPL